MKEVFQAIWQKTVSSSNQFISCASVFALMGGAWSLGWLLVDIADIENPLTWELFVRIPFAIFGGMLIGAIIGLIFLGYGKALALAEKEKQKSEDA